MAVVVGMKERQARTQSGSSAKRCRRDVSSTLQSGHALCKEVDGYSSITE